MSLKLNICLHVFLHEDIHLETENRAGQPLLQAIKVALKRIIKLKLQKLRKYLGHYVSS